MARKRNDPLGSLLIVEDDELQFQMKRALGSCDAQNVLRE
jgi:hypothetical protein